MGLLDQLWDDTVAGPRPDNGLGKLRKHSSFPFRPNSSKESDGGSVCVRSFNDETTKVTRTIMIVKSPRYHLPERIASGFAGRIDSSGISFFWRKRVVSVSEKVCIGCI
ncbi:hypothetical protein V6N12_026254 [Hibiscus sabdariffa]|uniref:Uncharacterized protein n=1 Tax=Hibiscus sabdariffa TaxID=183260 RepID=A0ABR2DRQ9_9ROSI